MAEQWFDIDPYQILRDHHETINNLVNSHNKKDQHIVALAKHQEELSKLVLKLVKRIEQLEKHAAK